MGFEIEVKIMMGFRFLDDSITKLGLFSWRERERERDLWRFEEAAEESSVALEWILRATTISWLRRMLSRRFCS